MLSVKNTILTCPVCALSLLPYEKFYACENKHTFDKAKQGYVNLLLSNQKKTLEPGDNKEMVKSRIDFLKQNHYLPIVETINQTILDNLQLMNITHPNIVDLGCGVGYYLSKLKQALAPTFPHASYWGVDISKEAIHCANQQDKAISWLVSSSKNLPFASQSVDVILSVFAPLYNEEIQRVLSPNGKIFVVTPGRNHLFELRRFLFDELKEIDDEKLLQKTEGCFALEGSIPIQATIELNSSQEIEDLLKMTPFYWRSSKIKKDVLVSQESLSVTIDVILWVFSL